MADEEQSDAQPIRLESLSLPQLQQIYNQLENETRVLSNTARQLEMIINKYRSSISSIDKLKKYKDDKILIPCTESQLYVDGNLTQPNNVLVDIGTGYYNISDAINFFTRRIEYITQQYKSIESVLKEKVDTYNAVQRTIATKAQGLDLPNIMQNTKISNST
ncbi:hypothetical protein HZS_6914 [Henneguya salminicola]|nr:hypothetical protein HZS_6914 [Henneguya salminicola]